jgi:hypothetical protein
LLLKGLQRNRIVKSIVFRPKKWRQVVTMVAL